MVVVRVVQEGGVKIKEKEVGEREAEGEAERAKEVERVEGREKESE